MAAVKGLRGGDFRKEILPRPLTDDKPERTEERQTSSNRRGKCEGGTPSPISASYPCGYRREQNKVKTLKKPVISRVFGFLFVLVERYICTDISVCMFWI